MLSKLTIHNKILYPTKDNFIKLKYSFLRNQSRFKYIKESKDVVNNIDAKNFFIKRLSENKLGITAGKLLKILNKNAVPSAIRFGGHIDIVDLEKCSDGYEIRPMESVVLLTNEWLHIDSNTTGVLLSRVSNYTKGLILSSSYVDSNWKGLLEVVITNFSHEPQRLCLGDEIGRIFFFKLDGIGTSSTESEVADNSHHFGLTWDSIIYDKVDPFQKTKADIQKVKQSFSFKDFFYDNYKIAGGIVGLIAVATILLSFYTKFIEFNSFKEAIDVNKLEIAKLKENDFETGSISIFFEKERISTSTRIELSKYFDKGKIIIINDDLTQSQNIKVTGILVNSGRKSYLELRSGRPKAESLVKYYHISYIVFH